MDAQKSTIFTFQFVKSILQTRYNHTHDIINVYHTHDTINDFRDSALVCKMQGCYCTISKNVGIYTYLPLHIIIQIV